MNLISSPKIKKGNCLQESWKDSDLSFLLSADAAQILLWHFPPASISPRTLPQSCPWLCMGGWGWSEAGEVFTFFQFPPARDQVQDTIQQDGCHTLAVRKEKAYLEDVRDISLGECWTGLVRFWLLVGDSGWKKLNSTVEAWAVQWLEIFLGLL